jgi:hypothetical protein
MTRRAYAAYLLKFVSAELGQNLVDTALMKQQRSRDDGFGHALAAAQRTDSL